MTVKEKILREIDSLSEQELAALYELVQQFLEAQRMESSSPHSMRDDPLAYFIGGVEHGKLAGRIDEDLYSS
jgi:hypothetical protein